MANYVTVTSNKNKKVALILCLLGGVFGLHYFYVGRWGKGFLFFFTCGFFVIGWILDIFSILLGSFRDNVGAPLRG